MITLLLPDFTAEVLEMVRFCPFLLELELASVPGESESNGVVVRERSR